MKSRITVVAAALIAFLLGTFVAQRMPFAQAQPTTPPAEVKGPKWLHGLEVRCRNFAEPTFSDKTRRFGIEVFRDKNNGNLIYVSENGSIAVVPAAPAAPPK